jgi:hypothetical protein
MLHSCHRVSCSIILYSCSLIKYISFQYTLSVAYCIFLTIIMIIINISVLLFTLLKFEMEMLIQVILKDLSQWCNVLTYIHLRNSSSKPNVLRASFFTPWCPNHLFKYSVHQCKHAPLRTRPWYLVH